MKSQNWIETQRDTIFNVAKKCFGKLYHSLKFMFDLSLESETCQDDF